MNEPIRLEESLYDFVGLTSTTDRLNELELTTNDFNLTGLGEAGTDCGKLVMTDVDIGETEDDIRAVKFKPLRCSRIQCPTCYYEWAIRQSFDVALKIEAMAEIRDERPFHVIFSIHPLDCYGVTWTDINQKLWRRGRRRLRYIRCDDYWEEGKDKHSVGDCPHCFDLSTGEYGGTGIFHPFRIRKKWKLRLGTDDDEDLDGSAKAWRKIRERLLAGRGELSDYVKIGYHAHNILFTDHPERHKDEKYVIKFAKNFERLSRKEVIALTRYLITHTATIREAVVYRNHVCNYCGHSYRTNEYRCGHCGRTGEIEETHVKRNRIVHPIRSYGILYNFDPKEALIEHFGEEEGLEIYHKLAHEIAESLYLRNKEGELITMEWNEAEEELEYPASPEEFLTSDEDANWVSIYKLFELLRNDDFGEFLSPEKREFVEDLLDYMRTEGKPPPLEDCSRDPNADGIYIPESISARIPRTEKADFDLELERSRLASADDRDELTGVSLLRGKIVDLLAAREDDVWALDICLPDYDLGEILRVLDWMSERGEVILFGEGVELGVSVPSASCKLKQESLTGGDTNG